MLLEPKDVDALQARLSDWLSASEVRLSAFIKPKAGMSNETFLFDMSWEENGQTRSMVARLRPTDFQVFPEYDLGAQCRVMQALTGNAVPVRSYAGSRKMQPSSARHIMERIDGEIPPEIPVYHAYGWCADASIERRQRVWENGLATLAQIHALDWRKLGLSFLGVPGDGTGPLDRQLAYYENYLDWVRQGEPQPVLQATLAWLKANRFTPKRVTLCWGDARLPNMIFRDDQVVAVLDWEMAFIGDPEADLGWWIFLDRCNSEGYGTARLAGFPSPAETVRRYEELSGHRVAHARYYEVFAAFRFGVIMARVAMRMKEIGLPAPNEAFERNNSCTQRLAALLDLPSPGEWPWPEWARSD